MACFVINGQNENKKWYFGDKAGLDFMQNPPAILTGSMVTQEGCASVADAGGNLLFYTDGSTIYTSTHTVMANGTGLLGNLSTTQAGVIVRRPGSQTIYYIFSLSAGGNGTLHVSTVDMSLAAGFGSVTVKNSFIAGNCTEKLTSVKHCNGVDVWVLSHDYNSTNFRAFLVTAVGVNTTAVVSSVGVGGFGYSIGYMKFSPNGKKLAAGLYSGNNGCELFDFDASTGVVSNAFLFNTGSTYGVEFSPDGTKLYGSAPGKLTQLDLCAGSNTAIAATMFTIAATSNWGIQLATNGKIYVTRLIQSFLGVINTPDLAGANCNYVDLGQSIGPNQGRLGLPNFITSGFKPPPVPFTHTVSNSFGCQTASFTAPPFVQNFTLINCVASGYSLSGFHWNFGDPASGANNTSTLTNPSHAFTNLGTYTTQLIINYSCGGGTDTIKQVVNINQPCISVSSTSITCSSLGSATVSATGGIGPYSYTWMPSAQSGSVATGLSPGTYTLTVFDFGNNFTYTATTAFISLIPLTGNLNHTSSLTCNGASTGTANYTNIAGGSPNQNYQWTNGISTYTTPYVSTLSAGLWSATVTDALTGCTINDIFIIAQPPALSLSLTASSPTSCAGTSVVISGTNSGGTPGYTYTWTPGPVSHSRTVSQVQAGTYVYTLTSRDSYSCFTSNTISVDFIPNPVLTLTNVSICPLETGTLVVTGAASYTWSDNSTGNTYTASPGSTSLYTVSGSALGCTSQATGYIIVKASPNAIFSSNSPVCNGQNLNLNVSQAALYIWSGPQGFSSGIKNPVISPAAPGHSGIYQVTITAQNNCTASTSGTVTVNPTPTLSAQGSTVCIGQTLNFSAGSFPGSAFNWTGPLGYNSQNQNPSIPGSSVGATGNYTVVVTTAVGCSNSAVAHGSVAQLPVPVLWSNTPRCQGEQLNFTASGGQYYSWNGPAGFSSQISNPVIPGVMPGASGIYNVLVTSGPCTVSNTLAVTVHPLPNAQINSNSPVCEGKALNLSAIGANLTGIYWQGPDSFTGNGSYIKIDSAKLSHTGTYTITLVDNNNCVNSSTTSVEILSNPTLTATGATVCLNEAPELDVTGASTYFWQGAGGYYSGEQRAKVPAAGVTGVKEFTVTGTAANGCTAVTTASVQSLGLPVPGLSVEPALRVCLNKIITLEGSGGSLYDWQGPDNLKYSGKKIELAMSNPAFAGVFTLTVTDMNGCRNYTTTQLMIDALPAGFLSGEKMEGCIPFCSDYSLSALQQKGNHTTVQWKINDTPKAGKKFSHCFNTAGTYTISGHFTDTVTGCENKADFYVHAHPLPVADFRIMPEVPVENTEPVLFFDESRGEGISKWTWHFYTEPDGASEKRGQNTSCFYHDAGNYAVALIAENVYGCLDTTVKQINVAEDYVLFVPDVFTPNYDGLNDVFLPVGRAVNGYRLQIFDRWGELLFYSDDLLWGWDGTFENKLCKTDIYNWKIILSTENGETKKYSGHVTLMR